MAIRKRPLNGYTDYSHLKNNYNESNLHNYSHESNLPTNFNLKSITLEDIDVAVFTEFNNRFKIGEKIMPLLIMDAEMSSLINQNYLQYDEDKQFMNGPFFTMIRTGAQPKMRSSPTNKKVIYTVPKQKAQGIVIEEYITTPPLEYDLFYDFHFITHFREYTNQMDTQMRMYFRNKRNMIVLDNDRFIIGPEDSKTLSTLDLVNNDELNQRTMYVSTFKLKLWCYTRDLSDMQKRERPNTFILDIITKESKNEVIDSSKIELNDFPDRLTLDNGDYPTHP